MEKARAAKAFQLKPKRIDQPRAAGYGPRDISRHLGEREAFVLDSLIRLGMPTKRILELGCGSGRITRRLAEALPHARITAVGTSSNQLSAAAEHCAGFASRITFMQADLDWLSQLRGMEFDLALALDLFARHPPNDVRDLLGHASAVSTYVVSLEPDQPSPERAPEPDQRPDPTAVLESLGLRCRVVAPASASGASRSRLVIAWGGTAEELPPGDATRFVGIRSQAEALSQTVLAERSPRFERDDALLDALEAAFVERARRPSLQLEGPLLFAPDSAAALHDRIGQLEVELQRLSEQLAEDADFSSRLRQAADALIPADAIVAVVSGGDDTLLALGDRDTWHFPDDDNGDHLTTPPADSAMAVSFLEAARAEGAEYLLLPRTAYWWFDRYGGFAEHMARHYRIIRSDAGDCLIVDLRTKQRKVRSLSFLSRRIRSR